MHPMVYTSKREIADPLHDAQRLKLYFLLVERVMCALHSNISTIISWFTATSWEWHCVFNISGI